MLQLVNVPTMWLDCVLQLVNVPTMWLDCVLQLVNVPTMWLDCVLQLVNVPTMFLAGSLEAEEPVTENDSEKKIKREPSGDSRTICSVFKKQQLH